MKTAKILYWIFFILGACLCVVNMFVNDIAVTISAIIVLVIAIVAYFISSKLKKKEDSIPQDKKRKDELQKEREDAYKRIREKKKIK